MNNLTTSAKLALIAVAVVGSIGFFLILEFGISAGRVHHGVTVDGWDVGGLTFNELQGALVERAPALEEEPVCFSLDAIRLCIDPTEVGWRLSTREITQEAFDVGRTDFPLGAINERAAAWLGGVDVPLRGTARGNRVGRILDRWERIVEGRGLELRRYATRKRIYRSLGTHPRKIVPLPIRRRAPLG
ncbi:MAG: hypothetical protein ACRDJL_03655 [Actinomycetota bacterium]